MTATQAKAQTVLAVEQEVRSLRRRIRHQSRENALLVHPDLQVSCYLVLIYVAERGPVRARGVVEDLDMDKSAVSRHIATLQDLGLVACDRDPGDGRARLLRLTEYGRARVRAVATHRQEEIARRLDSWTLAELTGFAEQLGRFNTTLDPVT